METSLLTNRGFTTAVPEAATTGKCDDKLMTKVYGCMSPLIAQCPNYTDTCIVQHMSELCSCTDDIDALVAQCDEAKKNLGPLQEIMPMLCSPCMTTVQALNTTARDCLQDVGQETVVNEKIACGSTCHPLLCTLVSSCTVGIVPGMSAKDIKDMDDRVSEGTKACPCSS